MVWESSANACSETPVRMVTELSWHKLASASSPPLFPDLKSRRQSETVNKLAQHKTKAGKTCSSFSRFADRGQRPEQHRSLHGQEFNLPSAVELISASSEQHYISTTNKIVNHCKSPGYSEPYACDRRGDSRADLRRKTRPARLPMRPCLGL